MLRTKGLRIMVKVEKFEDLIAWQKARELNKLVYQMAQTEPFERDYALKDQTRRSSISIMSNIAEGFDRAGRKEFHQFLVIAKASCAELRSQLYITHDINYINEVQFNKITKMAIEVSKIISGLRTSVAKDIKK